ncbi:preprotein translocase subunit SecE [Caulifigura coniformis]|uniref:preprotein translocase subunit SecE n=1 Tax=Caulifigura coniformis TaxID=2527983 RepID=UPI0018D204FE|nr:preprotein translocase subunit SecE [Caulifigura coniformis]
MAAANTTSLLGEMFSGGIYKRNQGRLVRQGTFFGIVAIVAVGCITLANTILADQATPIRVGGSSALAVLGAWFAWRVVNYPKFADFLIAVEGEMDKMSWPDWAYLWRALGVVLTMLVLFTAYMFVCDVFWNWLFETIRFLDISTPTTPTP